MSDQWPFEAARNTAVLTTSQVLRGKPILHVSHDLDDGGWQFHSEMAPQKEDAKIVALSEIVEMDPSILELADLPEGWVADRQDKGQAWVRSQHPEDGEGDVIGNVFRFTCDTCGKTHEGSPSLAFDSPFPYSVLNLEEKKNSSLDSDFCVTEDRDYFIRVILEIHIHGTEEPFTWGVWVSQSKDNYEAYKARFKQEDDRKPTFGWFSNRLPGYPDTLKIKTLVHFQPKGLRPKLELEKSDHPLCRDYHEGITWDRAIEIARLAMHPSTGNGPKEPKKKWWKIFL